MSPVLIAVDENSDDVLRVLLEAGAGIGALYGVPTTPLHYAAMWGSVSGAELLVEYGADISALSELGKTPLQIAEENSKTEIVELFRNMAIGD